ncbi:MAG: hypothetical protein PHN88_16185 [Ignavibacteria bacterium]|nr:hypothetical protein [Ignavibacteria bacterium]
MYAFLDSFFNNRPEKTDTENGEYYFGLLADSVNEVTGKSYKAWDMMDRLKSNDLGGVVNYYDTLGFYCRVVNFDGGVIRDAFEACARDLQDGMTMRQINNYLSGEASYVSPIGEDALKYSKDGVQLGKNAVVKVIDAVDSTFDNAVTGIGDTLKNLPTLLTVALVAVIIVGILWGFSFFKKGAT